MKISDTPLGYDPFAEDTGGVATATISDEPLGYDPFAKPIQVPEIPIGTTRAERAALTTQRGMEARVAQAAKMFYVGQNQADIIAQIQRDLDAGIEVDPAVIAQYQDYLDMPEFGTMKIEPGAVKPPVEPPAPVQPEPTAPPAEPTFEERRRQAAINIARADAELLAKQAEVAPSIAEIMLGEESITGDVLRSLGSMGSAVFAMVPRTARGVLDLPGLKQTVGDTAAGKLVTEWAERVESNRDILAAEVASRGGPVAELGQNLANVMAESAMTLAALGVSKVFSGGAKLIPNIKAAGKMAALGYIQTPGTQAEKLKAAALMGAFALTPIPASKMPKDWMAKAVNIVENLGISEVAGHGLTSEVPWTQKIPQALLDSVFGVMAKGRGPRLPAPTPRVPEPVVKPEPAIEPEGRVKFPQRIEIPEPMEQPLPKAPAEEPTRIVLREGMEVPKAEVGQPTIAAEPLAEQPVIREKLPADWEPPKGVPRPPNERLMSPDQLRYYYRKLGVPEYKLPYAGLYPKVEIPKEEVQRAAEKGEIEEDRIAERERADALREAAEAGRRDRTEAGRVEPPPAEPELGATPPIQGKIIISPYTDQPVSSKDFSGAVEWRTHAKNIAPSVWGDVEGLRGYLDDLRIDAKNNPDMDFTRDIADVENRIFKLGKAEAAETEVAIPPEAAKPAPAEIETVPTKPAGKIEELKAKMAQGRKAVEPPQKPSDLMPTETIHDGAKNYERFLSEVGGVEKDPKDVGWINSKRAFEYDNPDFSGIITTDYNRFYGEQVRTDRLNPVQKVQFENIMKGAERKTSLYEFDKRLHERLRKRLETAPSAPKPAIITAAEEPMTDFEVRYITKDGNRGKTWVQAENAQTAVSEAQKTFDTEGTGETATSAIKSEAPGAEPERISLGAAARGGKEFISGTALNKATTELERANTRLPPLPETERKAMAVEWARAEEAIRQDPDAPRKVVERISVDPAKPPSDAEMAILLRRKVAMSEELNEAASKMYYGKTEAEKETAKIRFDNLLKEYEELTGVVKAGLTGWGRTGRWAQMVADEDYTLGNMLMRARARKGGKELTGEEKLKIQMLQKDLEKAQKELTEAQKTAVTEKDEGRAQAERAFRDFVSEVIARQEKPVSFTEKTLAFVDSQADAAMARIKARRGRLAAGIDPTEMADYAIVGAKHIAHGIRDFTAWSARMISDFEAYVKPYLRQIWDASRKITGDYKIRERKTEPRAEEAEEVEVGKVVGRKRIRELMRAEVETGVTDLDTAIKTVRDIVAKEKPEITEREVRDIFSDYGKVRVPSQEPMDVTLRDLRAQSQKRSQLEDAMRGKPPKATGYKRDEPSLKVRELTKAVHAAMKKMGIVTTDPEAQLKSTLSTIKTRLSNSIEELNNAIAKRERLVINKAKIPYDAEANALKAQRDLLRKQYDEMFPPKPPTEEERYATALKSSRRNLEQWESKLSDAKKGIFPSEEKRAAPTSEEINDIRAKRDAARKEFEELHDLAFPNRKDELALKIYGKRLDRRIADLRLKLSLGLPAKRERKEIKPDKATAEKEFDLAKLEQRWKEMQFDLHLAQRSKWQVFGQGIEEVLNTFRALKASFDIGHIRRQGGAYFLSHPLEAIGLLPETIRAAKSEAEAFRIDREIRNDPEYLRLKKAGLFYHTEGTGLNAMEDAYRGRWWKKIPGLAGSGRLYTTGLNLSRHKLAKRLVKQLSVDGDGKMDAEALGTLTNFVNNWMGRGGLGKLESSARGVADVFFSARLVASRFNVLLAPFAGFRSYGKSVAARKIIAKEYARYLAGLTTYWGLIVAGASAFLGPKGDKWDIEFDPRSSQFGKIRIGNTTLDPLSGLQQPLVLMAKIISGHEKNQKGDIVPLYGAEVKYGGRDIGKVFTRFVRSKLSPGAGLITSAALREDFEGYPLTAKSIVGNTVVPMSAENVYDAVKDMYETFGAAGIPAGIILGLLANVGEGVQTWQERTPRERKELKKRRFWDWSTEEWKEPESP